MLSYRPERGNSGDCPAHNADREIGDLLRLLVRQIDHVYAWRVDGREGANKAVKVLAEDVDVGEGEYHLRETLRRRLEPRVK